MEPEGKDVTLLREKSAAAAADPRGQPHARSSGHFRAGVSAPCAPQPLRSARRWRLQPPGGARGRGSHPSPGRLAVPRVSAPRGRAQDPAHGSRPLPGADARPTEKSPGLRGQSHPRTRLTHLQKKALRSLSAQRHLQQRNGLAPRLDGDPEGPHVCPPTSDEKPPPRGRALTRAPLQPWALSPRRPTAIKSGTQGSGSHLRARAAGSSAARSPSGLPPRPAGPRAPRRALAALPLCDWPRPAAGARLLAKENGAGRPPGHPRPPISGGDPGRAGTAERARRAQGPP